MATFTDKPWDGSASRWKNDETYVEDCLIDLNPPGKPKVKALGKLPVREPDGAYNVNAIHAAVAALAGGRGGVQAPPEAKRAAARKLRALYREMKEELPPSIQRLAL